MYADPDKNRAIHNAFLSQTWNLMHSILDSCVLVSDDIIKEGRLDNFKFHTILKP